MVTLTARRRRVATVLVVVFLLTTVWAAFYLYSTVQPAGGARSVAVASYAQSAVNGFVASVRPSYLYNNSTEVVGGNTTLFTSITNWVNVSMEYVLSTNRSASISLAEAFSVELSTPVWSKLVYVAANSSELVGGTASEITTRYDVNVSTVVALASAIDLQLEYSGPTYTLSLTPAFAGTLTAAGVSRAVAYTPTFNLTFTGSLIVPSGLAYAEEGVLNQTAPPSGSSSAGVLPYAAMAASVGGLGGSVWFVTRRSDGEEVVPLTDIIAPYEEVIAATGPLPAAARTVPVADLSDLARIADTLGRPILRPPGSESGGAATFVVLDGETAYRYVHPPTRASSSGGPLRPDPSALPPPPANLPTTPTLVERLQAETERLRTMNLGSADLRQVEPMIRRALTLVRDGREEEAAEEIDRLSRYLTAQESRR